jgi:hypothetical protein
MIEAEARTVSYTIDFLRRKTITADGILKQ